MKIKICGITRKEELKYLQQEQVDYAGFVLFFPKSKRNLTLDQAKELLRELPEGIESVAVVVSPDEEQMEVLLQAGFSHVQIHGDVPVDWLMEHPVSVWKAFNVSDLEAFSEYETYDFISAYVFDASQPGSGKKFSWELLKELPDTTKMKFLAGGLNLENVEQACQVPGITGVDTSSVVEKEDGNGKDPERIKAFVKAIRSNTATR
ncbi:MAG: phosphoribosylanthranilate isomerase [Eubacterium sp.]|nr:phosphoribosylanthranilate isomerase [Eubacterium sp.]